MKVEDYHGGSDDDVTNHGFRATVNWPIKQVPPPPQLALLQLGKESDWIANADDADDVECESELGDEEDEIVSDTGFALASGNIFPNRYTNDQYVKEINFLQLDESN